jgi:hypothetical protein
LSESSEIRELGIDCGNLSEPLPMFVRAPCEKVWEGKNNSYIVLGRDRPATKHTGYGSQGIPGCGMIDLVAGRMSGKDGPKRSFVNCSGETERAEADPMFVPYNSKKHGLKKCDTAMEVATDAARVYIAQMTDVDNHFNLSDGTVGNSKSKSAVAIKADAVRIIGNEGIKIITNVDGINSGCEETTKSGIDLIANNTGRRDNAQYTKDGSKTLLSRGPSLQPLVKGDNLRACLDEVVEELVKLQSTMQGFINQVIMANMYWGSHQHPPAVPYIDVMPRGDMVNASIDVNNTLETKTIQSVKSHSQNFNNIKEKFLKPNGKCFINSRYNNTN